MTQVMRENILNNKKDFIRNAVERTIDEIEIERINFDKDFNIPRKILGKSAAEKFQSYLNSHREEILKERARQRIRELRLVGDNYIWVNRVVNFSGGDGYAIREVHPNLPKTEGKLLSTSMQDAKGNTPYLTELEGVKKNGHIFFRYWFKKLQSDEHGRK